MLGVVPAAGEGTRLGSLTAETPKPLLEVAGQPLLSHVFETLRASGVEKLVVVVGYRASEILERYGESFEGIPITYVHQRDRQGLGHAVGRAAPHVDGPFVVLNGDNVVAGDLREPIAAQAQDGVDAVVAVERVEPATARETGVVTVEDGRVTEIVEKPEYPPSQLVTTGCYVLPETVIDALGLLRPSGRGEYELTDAVGVLRRAGLSVRAVELDSPRVNVNTPADVERAAALLSGGEH